MTCSCSDRRRYAAVCGEYCLACEENVDGCRGCAYEMGCVAQRDCAVFQCAVVERGIAHCGLCPDFPCDLFRSDAEPARIELRIRALIRRREIGTERWLIEQELRTTAADCLGEESE